MVQVSSCPTPHWVRSLTPIDAVIQANHDQEANGGDARDPSEELFEASAILADWEPIERTGRSTKVIELAELVVLGKIRRRSKEERGRYDSVRRHVEEVIYPKIQ